ncbi:MAG: AraC family transcriptional regulator [Acidobacteriia bacterium]|nr:AraC family transcriptional regulator [Terriglobia bacterium]
MNRYLSLIETPQAAIGRFDHPAEDCHHDLPEEVSAEHSIGLVERGRFSIQIGHRTWNLRPGDLFLTYPGLAYKAHHDEEVPTDVCVSVTYLEQCDEVANLALAARKHPVIPATNRVTYLFRTFSTNPSGTTAALAAEDAAVSVLSEVCAQQDPGKKRFSHHQLAWYAERVDATRARLESHLTSANSLTSLARSVGMSPFHFARVFRELAGVPPHRYLLQVRLKAAARQLRQGASVTEACFNTGFSNLSHFIRSFRRAYGVSPARYARQNI